MFKHILIATDGSELSQKAVTGGLELAQALGAMVTGYSSVVDYLPMSEFAVETPQAILEQLEQEADNHLALFCTAAHAAGVKFDTVRSIEFSPYNGIIETAKRLECDLIMMASHGRRGLTGLLLGSETQKVLTHSQIPVLVYR